MHAFSARPALRVSALLAFAALAAFAAKSALAEDGKITRSEDPKPEKPAARTRGKTAAKTAAETETPPKGEAGKEAKEGEPKSEGEKPAPQPEPKPPVAPEPSLYERLGGVAKLSGVANTCADFLVVDETLGANKELKEALEKAPRASLRYHLTSLLCAICGGPERYAGPSLGELHRTYKPDEKAWAAARAAFEKALKVQEVPAALATEAGSLFDGLRKALEDALPAPYDSEKGGYAVNFPKAWEVREQNDGLVVTAVSPLLDKTDPFNEHVRIRAEDLLLPMTTEEYTKACLLAARRARPDFQALGARQFVLSGQPAAGFLWTHAQNKTTLRELTVCFADGTRGYEISCVVAADQAANYQGFFDEILRSFLVKAKPKPEGAPAPAPVEDKGAAAKPTQAPGENKAPAAK
ncbi:MAG: hypothetical protein L6R28_06090 [Planctomycetes bacterium]|nr:hypothetical protein [Planctomycetota bacterium]